jgi:uncharacterized membrane protein
MVKVKLKTGKDISDRTEKRIQTLIFLFFGLILIVLSLTQNDIYWSSITLVIGILLIILAFVLRKRDILFSWRAVIDVD